MNVLSRDGPAHQRSGARDTTNGVVCEFRVAVDGQRRLWLPWSPGASSPAPASAISTPAAGWPSSGQLCVDEFLASPG